MKSGFEVGATYNHQTQSVLVSVQSTQPPATCGVTMFNAAYDDVIALWNDAGADARHSKIPALVPDKRAQPNVFRDSGSSVIHLHDKVFLQLFLTFHGTLDDRNFIHLQAIRVEATRFACGVYPEICDAP